MHLTGLKRFSSFLRTNECIKNVYIPYALLAICLMLRYGYAAEAITAVSRYHPGWTQASQTQEVEGHECNSVDIRNECKNFDNLRNCTVIKGYLMIVLLPKDKYINNGNETCNYDEIRFPLLREVTDYIIMFHVKGLKTIRDMFPNLTVIRGRRLFLNYAIGITEMPDLEAIEFRSLVAIQRGHVFIGSSPKLCQLEKINWDRLTLTTGQNFIFPVNSEKCEQKPLCNGCPYQYCWSNMVCQKFENDNIVNLRLSTKHCHEECLGGCFNMTNAGCAVCRRLNDHGVCVSECPPDKFMHEHTQRCYTHDECVKEMRLRTYQGSCVSHCPGGFKSDSKGTCIPCVSKSNCTHICQPEPYTEDLLVIYNLADADRISSCQYINGTLMITIRNKINENDLAAKFKNIREIKGYLKIFRSPYLTSLRFLNSIKKIGGIPSESHHYSLIVYDNKNLQELWKPQGLELEHGGMYIHSNNKLCSQNLMEFSEKVIHDRSLDSLQQSDQETLCGPIKLSLDIQVLSHHELLFSWPKDQTADEIEVMYRPLDKNEIFTDQSELETPVCQRINWHRELIFKSDLNDNGTYYSYKVDSGLKQNTRYACMVKTFGSNYKQSARSDLVYMTTKLNIPPPPIIKVIKKTENSLAIDFKAPNDSLDYSIDYYLLEVYKIFDDVNYLDKRNFCQQPSYFSKHLLNEPYSESVYNEDYDDCCARLEDDMDDEQFMTNIRNEFSCSLDRKENCESEKSTPGAKRPLVTLNLSANQSTYELHHLERYGLYVFMVKACNEIACSSVGMHSERTSYSTTADLVGELEACTTPETNEYRVYFTEPKQPNGAIVSYTVHLKSHDHEHSHIGCVTRQEHQNSYNIYIRHINMTFDRVGVRTHSLAGDVLSDFLHITKCDDPLSTSSNLIDYKRRISDMAKNSGHGVSMFFIVIVVGCMGASLWCCIKHNFWRRLPELRQYLTLNRTRGIRLRWDVSPSQNQASDDSQILVDNYETVRFKNRRDDDDDEYDRRTNYSNLSLNDDANQDTNQE